VITQCMRRLASALGSAELRPPPLPQLRAVPSPATLLSKKNSFSRVQDGARLTVRIRFISPEETEETQTALTRLREHGATGYGGYGPPTATEVGFHGQDFVTLPEELLELLLFLPDLQKLSLN
jgi:hypothetical protein